MFSKPNCQPLTECSDVWRVIHSYVPNEHAVWHTSRVMHAISHETRTIKLNNKFSMKYWQCPEFNAKINALLKHPEKQLHVNIDVQYDDNITIDMTPLSRVFYLKISYLQLKPFMCWTHHKRPSPLHIDVSPLADVHHLELICCHDLYNVSKLYGRVQILNLSCCTIK